MIWKNGRFHLNRTATALTFLIFALFSAFFLSSSASAINLTNASYSNYYANLNNLSGGAIGGYRYTTYSLNDVVGSSDFQYCGYNNCYNSNAWKWDGSDAIKRILLTYNNVTFQDNSASLHLEMNYIISQPGRAPLTFPSFPNLDKLVVRYSEPVRSFSEVSFALTNWTQSIQSGSVVRDFYQTTLTLYVDVALKNLINGNTGNIYLEIGTTDDSPIIMPFTENSPYQSYYPFATFVEQNPTTILYFSSPNEALQQTQINILNNTYQLQQSMYDQDQADRSSVQNVSDNANQDGSDASSNAESATSSLLGAITNIYNQLLHPSTSNCIIEGVQIYDMNLGNLDFCTGFTIPQPVFAIGALIMIGLIILLAWSILKAGMSLYNELLGGKT